MLGGRKERWNIEILKYEIWNMKYEIYLLVQVFVEISIPSSWKVKNEKFKNLKKKKKIKKKNYKGG